MTVIEVQRQSRFGNGAIVPDMSRTLTAIRHVLRNTIAPQINDASSLASLETIEKLLTQLAALGESEFDAKLLACSTEQEAIGAELARITGAIDGGDEPQAIESLLGKVFVGLPAMSEVQRSEAERLLRRTVEQEVDFLAKLPAIGVNLQPDAIEPVPEASATESHVGTKTIDPVRDEARIADILRRRPGWEAAAIESINEVHGGTSKRTFIVRLRDGHPVAGVVIRFDSINGSGPVDGTVQDEAPILRALHKVGFPVAEVIYAESNARVLGSPFLMVEFLAGKASLDIAGTRFGDDAADHARLLARVLARLHRLDIAALDLPDELTNGSMQDHIVRVMEKYERQWQRRRLSTSSIISTCFAWLRRNIPDDGRRAAIVHGDVSLRNMLFHEGTVSAVLDWETWHPGDPMEDLVYCRRDIERVMPWQEFLDEYHAHGGSEYREDAAQFYEIWLQVRNSIMAMSMLWDFDTDKVGDLIPPSVCYSYYTHHLRTMAGYLTARESIV